MIHDEALKRMVSPGQRRERIWRNGVLQIFIARACDKKCFGCTQNSQLAGKPNFISVDNFERALSSLNFGDSNPYFGVVGMFGGNPAIHPKFDELCEILRSRVPKEQRGLWCNNPMGKGAIMRRTFNPAVSNLNVHQDQAAYDEFARDWPECRKELKGLTGDSRHSPPWVAMRDLDILPGGLANTEENRLDLIANCDINKYWSAMLCEVRGELRAFFCEIAAAQAMRHQDNPNWAGTGQPMPDTGMAPEPGWWRKSMVEFSEQVRVHCHACGIPLRGHGSLANGGPHEFVSDTHSVGFKPKDNRNIVHVSSLVQLGDQWLPKATDYIQNGG